MSCLISQCPVFAGSKLKSLLPPPPPHPQDGNKRVLTITQKKFCADGNITGFEDMRWKVPVTIATSKNLSAMTFVLEKETETVTLEGVGADDWIMVRR